MTLEAARIAVACLLWGVASSAYSAAEPGPEHPRSPELVEAWQLLGEDQRALREARQLAVEEPESWRAQAAYIEAASHSHLRWAVVDEYRWLAEQHPDRPELAALVCWAELLQARGAELDGALARLERLSEAAGRPGALLLADGLLYAGAHERAAELLLGARPPAAMALRVEALVGAGAHREAAKLVSFALREHPRHPEVGAALWQRGVPARQVQRARQRAVEAAERLLDSEDPNELFAAWSILARAKQTRGAQRAADGLAVWRPRWRPRGRARCATTGWWIRPGVPTSTPSRPMAVTPSCSSRRPPCTWTSSPSAPWPGWGRPCCCWPASRARSRPSAGSASRVGWSCRPAAFTLSSATIRP
jgi:tetratricopeptide (TPR) repeat protein